MAHVVFLTGTGLFKARMRHFGFNSVTVTPTRGRVGKRKRIIRVKINKRKGQTPSDAFNAVFSSLVYAKVGGFGIPSPGDSQKNKTTINFPISES